MRWKNILLLVALLFPTLGYGATIQVSGTIAGDTSWVSTNIYHVTDSVTVNAGVTLTIEPGVVVKFEYSDNSWPGVNTSKYKKRLIVNGVLNAQGTSGSPIVFTSIRDDGHGGDSNGDGSGTTPAAGDWGYVQINNAGSTLKDCQFWYGGIGRVYGGAGSYSVTLYDKYMLWINRPNPAVDVRNCQFHNAYEYALLYQSGDYAITLVITTNTFTSCPIGIAIFGNNTGQATVTGNTLSGCSAYGIYVTGVTSDSTVANNTVSGGADGIWTESSSPAVQNNAITSNTGYPVRHSGAGSPSYSGNTITGNRYQVIAVSGALSGNVTWGNVQGQGLPYCVVNDVTVNSSVTLTIEPGVVVKFEYSDNSWPGVNTSKYKKRLIVNGVLNAQGTSGSPIVFTSIRDDGHGGDSNGDGSGTTPAAGDWGYVQINNAGSTLKDCQFWYGGIGRVYGGAGSYSVTLYDKYMLWINRPNPAVDVRNCQFHNAYEYALLYQSGDYAITLVITTNTFTSCPIGIAIFGNNTGQATVTGNTLSGCSAYGIYVTGVTSDSTVANNTVSGGADGIWTESSSPAVQNNAITSNTGYPVRHSGAGSPSYSGNTITGNRYQVIAVSGALSGNVTWGNVQGQGLPYCVVDDVTVNSSVTLTIEPGVVVKFEYSDNSWPGVNTSKYKKRLIVNGVLNAQGTSGSPIVFTSIRDDGHGGDSNGDGSGTTPAAGDWGYVQINNAGSTLKDCQFWYGGIGRVYGGAGSYSVTLYDKYMLWINRPNPAVDVRNCQFHNAYEYALLYQSGDYAITLVITTNTFTSCPIGIAIFGNNTGQATVTGNTLSGCSAYGIYVTGVTSDSTVANNTVSGGADGIWTESSSPAVQNNAITSNTGYPVRHSGAGSPSYSGNTITGNRYQVIAVSGALSGNVTWGNVQGQGLPYCVVNDVTVNSSVTLTIEPGVVVKFEYSDNSWPGVNTSKYKKRLIVNGVLNAQGTSGSPIVFTSIRDDGHGGDSNGDGSGTTPAAGDWGYVQINNAGSTLKDCQFWYGGIGRVYGGAGSYSVTLYDKYMLWILAENTFVRRSVFKYAYETALNIQASGVNPDSIIVSANTFDHCPTGINYSGSTAAGSSGRISMNEFKNGSIGIDISRVGSDLSIQWNSFTSLTTSGVRSNDSTTVTNAEANWWGDASGPSGQGTGTGVPVSGNVQFSNWWTSPTQNMQGVWNVIAWRRGDSMLVDIYYDLVGDSGMTYRVSIAASLTGGEPYTIIPTQGPVCGTVAACGAVGGGIRPAERLHVVWDAAADGGGPYTNRMRVRVTADLE